MKKQLLAAALAAGTCVLAGATPVAAQGWDYGVRVNVPFAFTVGRSQLPAGSYYVRRANADAEDTFVVESASRRGPKTLFEATESVTTSRAAKVDELVFTKVADHYFLTKVDAGADGAELRLAEPKAERRLLATGSTLRIEGSAAAAAPGM